ncbi:phenylalanine--tRNA ligase subunit alpha [Mycoplasma phocimorsus]|uniref:phenylalanine--tRNA ligase n=1 Tax=Mycoplasma phocimorsus TaxID=3045839 RepID=A0AAJ1UWR8_9MOLU|nr:phenylalanine--tRNA ligase subunit alpha [Mycoplasma phocimorsus]MDJ1645942.1 phenylalanine--tRNA ligase subunit alpha [Mycoplasma phocimorsus]MDJ1646539.1 phenylalanine--tRNA ligase subunit alpha [Mycoplasma phocimorsus]MDJ1647196.1 phenylalanine--tRNA ligase subunit alpha [Mycoplasma phocimorsus]MDJ1647349.1 phenylalanine--tRNA ligase subunit alpha [Mycoplasma phocimorsus]MDJ1648538.1 phenylalanine--tRNA ligase subunit alpha [Mycoplasma phocimorsus]
MEIKLENIKTLEDLKNAKNKVYGPGSEIANLKNSIKSVSIEERKIIGKKLSELNAYYEHLFQQAAINVEENRINELMENDKIDMFEPVNLIGSIHPLKLIENRLRTWFLNHNYYESKYSEIESDLYNFERLNITKDHPARDMQDSLYIDEETLLRTHNTGMSARELEINKNKSFYSYAIGKVYRNDEDDATHSHQFTQLDFVGVGEISFSQLIETLKDLLTYVLETNIEIRLRPSYFPFTEPSVEVDVWYNNCWIEILGAGMVHPEVMKAAGYTNNMNGFAAGLGIERIAMIKYNIKDIREFYINDLRFLNQFKNK